MIGDGWRLKARLLAIAVGATAAGPAHALDISQPPSVLAERYGRDAAELAACQPDPNTLKSYIDGAGAAIGRQSKKPADATANVAIFEDSFKEQSARYRSEAAKPSCDDLGARLLPVNTR